LSIETIQNTEYRIQKAVGLGLLPFLFLNSGLTTFRRPTTIRQIPESGFLKFIGVYNLELANGPLEGARKSCPQKKSFAGGGDAFMPGEITPGEISLLFRNVSAPSRGPLNHLMRQNHA
jgi:hypothetical protein